MKSQWSLPVKAVFLFLSTYAMLYIVNYVFKSYEALNLFWEAVIPPFAKIWGYEKSINTSLKVGDFVMVFFKMCFCICVAMVTIVIILLIDFKRNNYKKLLAYLTVGIRYFMCYMMLSFGIIKILTYGQFTPLSEAYLSTKFGDMSPGGLLYGFMSYSRPYLFFAGILEIAGGLLLLSRKTVRLGAFILLGIMINVLVLNLCYNFFQKILSIHLVLMLLYLIVLDRKALFQYFIPTKLTIPDAHNTLITSINIKYQKFFKYALIALMLGYFSYDNYNKVIEQLSHSTNRNITHFFGEHYISQNSRTIDGYPLSDLPDSLNWKAFYQIIEDKVLIKTENNELINFVFEPDIEKQLFRIKWLYEDKFYELAYEHIDSNKLRVNGRLAGYYLDFNMHRTESFEYLHNKQSDYRLLNDKFRWIYY